PRVALLRELHGRLDESAEAWRLAAEDAAPRSQGRAWALASLANVALRKGQLADAEAGYRAALAEQTWYAVAHVGLARCFVAKGELALAAATLEALAVFLADHDRELDRAVAVAREEVAARPTVFAEDALAWALLKAGHASEAKEHADRARRLGTLEPGMLYHAGAIEAALGHAEDARRLL